MIILGHHIQARLVTGEIVSGTVTREAGGTVWIACDDGRAMWAYRGDVLPSLRVVA